MHVEDAAFCCLPVNTTIRDRNTVLQVIKVIGYWLVAKVDVAFNHQSDDGAVSLDDLVGNILRNQGLQCRIFLRVLVAAVDHDMRTHAGIEQRLFTACDVDGVLIGLTIPATQDDMAVFVAGRAER